MSLIHKDLVIEFPFTIGTVPIHASLSEADGVISNGTSHKSLPPPMFEEDVRSEQFESNTFKPRYPVFLNDPNAPGHSTAKSGPAAPPSNTNNLYPSAKVASVTPASPRPVISPSAPPTDAPYAPPKTPSAPATSTNQPSSAQAGSTRQPSVEFLGFSIPPDYEPTQVDSAANIGWK